MSEHLEKLAAVGVCSFKIEGRMKSEYYLATVVNAYRRILDGGFSEQLGRELGCAAHRDYTTAYAFGKNAKSVSYDNSQTKGSCEFIGIVRDYKNGRVSVEMRNRFHEGEKLEVLSPSDNFLKEVTVAHMRDCANELCADAKRVQEIYSFDCSYPLHEGDIVRRRK